MEMFFQWIADIVSRLKFFVIVPAWEEGVRLRAGKFHSKVGQGFHWMIPVLDQVETMNVLVQVIDLPNQNIETQDRKVMQVSGFITYAIKHADRPWLKVQNHDSSLRTKAMGLIAEHINGREYSQVTIAALTAALLRPMRQEGFRWGVEIEEVGITDLCLQRVLGINSNSIGKFL